MPTKIRILSTLIFLVSRCRFLDVPIQNVSSVHILKLFKPNGLLNFNTRIPNRKIQVAHYLPQINSKRVAVAS